jgi:hypothetical protein
MASDEIMTKLAIENMWRQWHAAPGSMETKERGRYKQQGTNQKGIKNTDRSSLTAMPNFARRKNNIHI